MSCINVCSPKRILLFSLYFFVFFLSVDLLVVVVVVVRCRLPTHTHKLVDRKATQHNTLAPIFVFFSLSPLSLVSDAGGLILLSVWIDLDRWMVRKEGRK